ncbi:hypothetical protein [Mycoplana dimorpha]|uniref:Protoheme IX farnesyltransferase n=1 Tax=Mycoplana dimorpha TaxID=28320 RepID=A0A2T5BHK7_MYCDI|nr:hypothetical protein [Mycoplana dimorpha]PTM98484.1 hypothetical protein C7449_101147 [Mycoplana dimorpha]
MQTVTLNDKQKKARRSRNVALALTLGGLVVLFYIVSLVKISGGLAG